MPSIMCILVEVACATESVVCIFVDVFMLKDDVKKKRRGGGRSSAADVEDLR